MNNLSIASVLETSRISSENALVFALKVDILDPITNEFKQTLRVVNHTTDLTIDGEAYVRLPFMLDLSDELGEMKNVTLSIQDQANVVLPYLKQYRGGTGSLATVSIVTVAPDNPEAVAIDFSEVFSVVASSSSNYVVSLTLGAENPLKKLCPSRTQLRDRCVFRYKSIQCGYKGDLTSCDLTLRGKNGCEAHGNTRRFGGFPSLTIQGT